MKQAAQEATRKRCVVILVAIISFVFLYMIRQFIMAILIAAIFSGLLQPLFNRMCLVMKGRRSLASASTLLVFVLVILVPLLALLAIIAGQALHLTNTVTPLVQDLITQPDAFAERLQQLPIYDRIEPYREQILVKVGELVESIGGFVVRGLSGATRGTMVFFFHLFIVLYAMFFLLKDGRTLLKKMMFYMPLPHEDEVLLVNRFVSVSRATLKGTLVIGLVQGGLAGLAFAVVGVGNSVFWGAVMAVLSIIPGIGASLVWIPATCLLLLRGETGAGIGLAIWCALIVGSADNFLRPRLVGKDTQMHDLLILLGTLGGIILFGLTGFIIGPIVAALFVTGWEIYGTVFKDDLPEVGPLGDEES